MELDIFIFNNSGLVEILSALTAVASAIAAVCSTVVAVLAFKTSKRSAQAAESALVLPARSTMAISALPRQGDDLRVRIINFGPGPCAEVILWRSPRKPNPGDTSITWESVPFNHVPPVKIIGTYGEVIAPGDSKEFVLPGGAIGRDQFVRFVLNTVDTAGTSEQVYFYVADRTDVAHIHIHTVGNLRITVADMNRLRAPSFMARLSRKVRGILGRKQKKLAPSGNY